LTQQLKKKHLWLLAYPLVALLLVSIYLFPSPNTSINPLIPSGGIISERAFTLRFIAIIVFSLANCMLLYDKKNSHVFNAPVMTVVIFASVVLAVIIEVLIGMSFHAFA